MIMRSAKVPESPSSALQTTYFCGWKRPVRSVRPLDAAREASASAPAQPRGLAISSMITFGTPAQVRVHRPRKPAMRAVIAERQVVSMMPQRAKVKRV